jgi:beta-ketoacyl-acyl-carrier-protein synthase II
MGVISPIGLNKQDFLESLQNGVSGVSRISYFDAANFPVQIAAEVKGFQPENYFTPKEARRLDKFVQYALAATKEALSDAALDIAAFADRVGVIVGSGIGGLETLEQQHKVLLEKGPTRVSPFLIPMMIPNLAAGQISIFFGAKGPNYGVVSACASANHAIGAAFELIKNGFADCCITGGAEAPITPLSLAGFSSMKALSTRNDEPEKASRPFDADRDGFIIGEGAGILILEESELAKKRGAKVYAEVVGYGASADAYHITAPDITGSGAAKAMKEALIQANVKPEQVDYINAHGTSTEANDKLETLAIKTVFGRQAYNIPISSTKSMTGHLLGAAAAIELIATVLALEHSFIPPTINYETPDPNCDLNYVPNKSIKQEVNVAMSNSFGFGGQNAVILVKKYK